ncbi:RNA polymerase sigma factor [Puia sp. P3]|uniref:RNA polymerase sigma factor n=1 Tax=Puia sp. P3 TaxID=3423952 RepID=UPI003D672D32
MSPIDLHSDLELLSRVREGDESAFEAIYKRYYSLLYIHACKLLKESGEAEDCVQEVFPVSGRRLVSSRSASRCLPIYIRRSGTASSTVSNTKG